MSAVDPVLEVTGVPAAALLARVAERRSGAPATVPAAAGALAPRRLLDYGDGTNPQFVREAHLLLLGRAPTEGEQQRRLAELGAGATRLELLVRLALCEEGRRPRGRDVTGPGLGGLLALGRAVERAGQRPALSAAAGAVVPLARRAASSRGRPVVRSVVRGGAVAAGLAVAGWRRRHVQGQVAELTVQVEQLRGGRA